MEFEIPLAKKPQKRHTRGKEILILTLSGAVKFSKVLLVKNCCKHFKVNDISH